MQLVVKAPCEEHLPENSPLNKNNRQDWNHTRITCYSIYGNIHHIVKIDIGYLTIHEQYILMLHTKI